MSDWIQGVSYGIAEMGTIIKKHNALINGIDSLLQVFQETGFVDLIKPQLKKLKERLQSDIVELNELIEKQKA